MKKKIISLVIIISIIVVLEIIVVLLKNPKAELFISYHYNSPWVRGSNGYKIYNDGRIEEYNTEKTKTELKVAKITNYELTQLKKLAMLVRTNYIEGLNPISKFYPNSPYGRLGAVADSGIEEKRIYKSAVKKWITLYKFGDEMGYNDTEETKRIIELTNQLEKKYLKAEVD